MKDPNKVKLGKKTRAAGKRFEKLVEKDLESQGWIVVKWGKQVEFFPFSDKNVIAKAKDDNSILGRLINCKPKFNFFTKSLMMNSGGFPDFLCIKWCNHSISPNTWAELQRLDLLGKLFEVQLVESKINNKLDKEEKEKMAWIEENLRIPCFVAYPEKVGRKNQVKLRRWNE
jgi:hypothetical protein